jgi:hypothetical protein
MSHLDPDISDAQRVEFLEKLVMDARKESGIQLAGWEIDFTGSFKKAYRPYMWFTNPRRVQVDRLWKAYGGEINHPYPDDHVDQVAPAGNSIAANLPPAIAGACMMFKRDDDRRQVRCNAPATLQRPGGFRYCASCAEVATNLSKRAGQTITLIKYP